jgi:hypothetical protein
MHAPLLTLLLLAPPAFTGAPPPSSGSLRPPAEEAPLVAARSAILAASRGDPPIAEVQAAAARRADPLAGAEELRARGRIAALLPRISAELRWDDRTYRVAGLQASGEVDYVRDAPGWSAAVTATWELGAVALPAPERIDAAGLLARARRRDEAVRSATSLYFERRRLRLSLALDPPANALDRAAAELEVARLGAELDALTGGLFGGGGR